MSSNYSIIIDKWERHEDYVRHIFRDLFLGTNSTLNRFIERNKDDCYTGKEFLERYLIHNDTFKHNNILAETKLTKTDQKDARIIAITNRLSKLEKNKNSVL